MIIFFESGRLGNQLFQYCAIKKIGGNIPVVVIGMKDFKKIFSGVELVGSSVYGRFLEKVLQKIGKNNFVTMSKKMSLISLVEEVQFPDYASFKVTPGWFKKMVYFDEGYYQANNIVESVVTDQLTLKEHIRNEAIEVLKKVPCRPEERFFVHVRRGDYLQWPSPAYPAVLPASWYTEQIGRIRDNYPNAHFVIVSDDLSYIENLFSKAKNTWIIAGDIALDFAVMTECHGGGVLSASSFSWWAAYFSRRKNRNGVFIAPRYWAGHRQRQWFPICCQTDWINYCP